MSTPWGKSPQVSWETIARVADLAEGDRLEVKSVAQIDEELRGAGFDDDAAEKLLERALGAEVATARDASPHDDPPARSWPRRVEARPPRKGWSPAAYALLAAAVVLLFLLASRRRELVAWWREHPQQIGPDRPGPDREPSPTPQERAAVTRDEAYAACDEGRWALCEKKLDEAKALDPAGDAEPRVQRARQQAYDGQHPDAGDDKRQRLK